jgi:undecaprenyl-diphosphatase
MLESILKFDTALFLFLNGIHSPFWDPIMIFFSGKLTWIPFYLLLTYLIYRKYGWHTVWVLLAAALVVTLADQSSVHMFKNVFERLRPCHNPEIKDLIHLATGRCAGGRFGFVSSHAANTFGVAMFLSLALRMKWFTVLMMFWALVVSYSRIYLGVHYPADIICGALLGLACGYVVWLLFTTVYQKAYKRS